MERNYIWIETTGEIKIKRPRAHEASSTFPTGPVEKDTSTFPLATIDSFISALRFLYGNMSKESEIVLRNELRKVA